MATPTKERWQLGSGDMEKLLGEVAAHKGESLWQDAWRRLRKNRAAFWSMIFLFLFGLTAFFAPLLPLASPIALSLRTEAAPPSWPWEAPPETTEETPHGAAITKSFGSVMDNGWRHRTVASFSAKNDTGGGIPDEVATSLLSLVEAESGRTAVLDRRAPINASAPTGLYFGVPFDADDAPRTDWRPTGVHGTATLLRAKNAQAWLLFEAPVDETEFVAWRVELFGTEGYLVLEDEGGALLRYRFELSEAYDGPVLGITFNGRHLAPSGRVDSKTAPGSIAEAPRELPEVSLKSFFGDLAEELVNAAAASGNLRVTSESDEHKELLFERSEVRSYEEEGLVHDDLAARLQRGLEGSHFPPGVTVTLDEVTSENGYWELGSFDRGLLWVRAKVFGLWQTGNWLGTDSKGRDILARIVWGSRTSIIVALVATLCSLLIGVTYGAFSGLMGGRIDNLMMRIVDILYSLPFIFVVIFLITIMNEYRTELADVGIGRDTAFYVVIGAIYWLTMARVVRGQVLSLKNSEFIEAARVIGASTPRILFQHLVPNVLSIVIVYLTLTIPAVMLFEAFLSFLGLGIEPPKVSWGTLAVDGTEAVNPVKIYWWLVVFPAMAMGSTLLALNVLGDGLRDALDPKMRGKD